ncbi:unnamed protein product [Acanthoscelides obtectus]|uniref:Ig-like domain-containing protein n=1 Tax=Acanthoscelides obtectus TaxID=200917 RepID=A0A9P0LWP6_ACAOB|nr:unnamed protein product [Acanthoscelides obtectus]CAK1668527.1 hypothetical protein AOBTE_LOCUS26462 [Acanthoscelides obtectus]
MGPFMLQLLYYSFVHGICSVSSSIGSPAQGLKWVRVSVPQYRAPGETATLRCDYDLGNDTLYAVKWYKDHEEFYRYVPKARPQKNWYKVEGVHVDLLCLVGVS